MNKKPFTSTPKDVTVVTVTYGNRRHYLELLIRAVYTEGVSNIVIVDNGSEWDTNKIKKYYKENFITIIKMDKNTGSAIGFSTGMEYAINSGAQYLWMLDDDNKPKPGSLSVLFLKYFELLENTTEEYLAVLSYRPAQQAIISSGGNLNRINPRNSGFHGFHIFDIPNKLSRRLPFKIPKTRIPIPEVLPINTAPYGGLLLNSRLIKRIGLPRKDFVIYADDTEYTYRITLSSGKIYVVMSSEIEDMESSWNATQRFKNPFSALLCGAGDFKAYYNMRNSTYLDEYIQPKNNFLFFINKLIFIIILRIFSIKHKKHERYKLLHEAVKDGHNKVLGLKQELPLNSPSD